MSPSGERLRIRCRSFPGLVSACVIDWLYPWPADALQKVAEYFLQVRPRANPLHIQRESYFDIPSLSSATILMWPCSFVTSCSGRVASG